MQAAKQRLTDIFAGSLRKLGLGMQSTVDFACTKVSILPLLMSCPCIYCCLWS